jgi:hypothetical protein
MTLLPTLFAAEAQLTERHLLFKKNIENIEFPNISDWNSATKSLKAKVRY